MFDNFLNGWITTSQKRENVFGRTISRFRMVGMNGIIKSITNSEVRFGAQHYKKQSCYILQDDHLAPLFTVGEIMNMAADLKVGHSLSSKRKSMLVSSLK